MYHANAKVLEPWRYEVAWRAKRALREVKSGVIEQLPVSMSLWFVLYRPKTTAKTRDTPAAICRPDLDKLARAIGDALTKVVYQDDSQIIESHCYKRIAETDEEEGVQIMITTNVVPWTTADCFGERMNNYERQ